MSVPQRVSIVSIGARDLASLRAFYANWGWTESEDADETWCAFDVGNILFSLYPIELLRDEAAPGEPNPGPGWNGVTIAINLDSVVELNATYDAAVAAGAQEIAPITQREWGGLSAYVADPEGNRWELAVSSEFA